MAILAPFAAVEALINQGVSGLLSNAVAVYKAGDPFGVIFDKGQTEAFDGGGRVLDGCDAVVSFNLANAPGLTEGSQLVIDGSVYTVLGGVQPDSSGWVQGVPVAALKG